MDLYSDATQYHQFFVRFIFKKNIFIYQIIASNLVNMRSLQARALPPGIHFFVKNGKKKTSFEVHMFMSLQRILMKLRTVINFGMIKSTGVAYYLLPE